jgi:hypothetical protein
MATPVVGGSPVLRGGCSSITGRKSRVVAILEDLNGVDEPVSVLKVAGIVLDVGFTGISLRGATGGDAPDIASPLSAEGGVESLGEIVSYD